MLPAFNASPGFASCFTPTSVKINDDIVKLFTRMYNTLELGFSTDNLHFISFSLPHFLSFFMYNDRHFPSAAAYTDDFIKSAMQYMQENVTGNISLKDLCRQYNYSVSRFSSLFKQKTGYSPIDYFIQMKMQKASQQLNFTDQSIKTIAMNMGFEDRSMFSASLNSWKASIRLILAILYIQFFFLLNLELYFYNCFFNIVEKDTMRNGFLLFALSLHFFQHNSIYGGGR